jgi:desulfoferrodoxin (superoxide reductase-like protein)
MGRGDFGLLDLFVICYLSFVLCTRTYNLLPGGIIMNRQQKIFFQYVKVAIASFFLLTVCLTTTVSADKSSVNIDAPETVKKGAEITIKVTALHDSNNMFHYTNWLYIMINDKEVARWDYSWNKKPEDKTFTKEITYTVNEPVEVKAEANCNVHGSEGPQTVKIAVTDN